MSYNPQNPNGQATSANSAPVVIASDQSAVPVSAASLPLPTGAAQDSTLTSGNAKVNVTNFPASQPVSGTVTVQQATASNLKVDLSGTAANATAIKIDGSAVTQPISASALPLPTGAATSAAQSTANTSLSTIATNTGNIPAKGQATGANSTPVVIASDQSSIPVSVAPSTSGGWSVSSQTALSNTKTSVKGSAGNLGGYMLYNSNAAATYVQVFDATTANVTVGTTTPTYVVALPPAAAANVEFTLGIAHANAITIAATTTATGSSAPAAAVTGFILYK